MRKLSSNESSTNSSSAPSTSPDENPSQAQRHRWPGGVLMEDIELREILIPKVSLLALQRDCLARPWRRVGRAGDVACCRYRLRHFVAAARR